MESNNERLEQWFAILYELLNLVELFENDTQMDIVPKIDKILWFLDDFDQLTDPMQIIINNIKASNQLIFDFLFGRMYLHLKHVFSNQIKYQLDNLLLLMRHKLNCIYSSNSQTGICGQSVVAECIQLLGDRISEIKHESQKQQQSTNLFQLEENMVNIIQIVIDDKIRFCKSMIENLYYAA